MNAPPRASDACRRSDEAGSGIRCCESGRSGALDAHGDAHPPTDTECCKAALGVALLHLEEERYQHAPTRSTNRMAKCDGAAIDVDLARVPAEVLVDGTGLGRERLVRLDEIEIVLRPACALQGQAACGNWARAHDRRVDAGGGP